MTYPLSSASFAGHSAPVWYFWHCFPGNPSLTWCDWQGYQAAVGLAWLCSLASLLPLCLKSSCFSQNSAFHTFCGSGDAQLQPVCTICSCLTLSPVTSSHFSRRVWAVPTAAAYRWMYGRRDNLWCPLIHETAFKDKAWSCFLVPNEWFHYSEAVIHTYIEKI